MFQKFYKFFLEFFFESLNYKQAYAPNKNAHPTANSCSDIEHRLIRQIGGSLSDEQNYRRHGIIGNSGFDGF